MSILIELQTERLYLKGITPSFIHKQYNSRPKEEIMRFFGFDEESYLHFKNMHEKGMETHRLSLYFFLLVEKETGLPIGECGFHTWNKTHERAELYYMIRNEEHKNKGLMTEAIPEVLKYGFTELHLHRVEALVAAGNEPSVRLLRRFGFTKEGTMREDYVVNGKNEDSDCYSLLKWEWKQRKHA